MKALKSLKSIADFKNSEISNLDSIKGGLISPPSMGDTGPGEMCMDGVCMGWDADMANSDVFWNLHAVNKGC